MSCDVTSDFNLLFLPIEWSNRCAVCEFLRFFLSSFKRKYFQNFVFFLITIASQILRCGGLSKPKAVIKQWSACSLVSLNEKKKRWKTSRGSMLTCCKHRKRREESKRTKKSATLRQNEPLAWRLPPWELAARPMEPLWRPLWRPPSTPLRTCSACSRARREMLVLCCHWFNRRRARERGNSCNNRSFNETPSRSSGTSEEHVSITYLYYIHCIIDQKVRPTGFEYSEFAWSILSIPQTPFFSRSGPPFVIRSVLIGCPRLVVDLSGRENTVWGRERRDRANTEMQFLPLVFHSC